MCKEGEVSGTLGREKPRAHLVWIPVSWKNRFGRKTDYRESKMMERGVCQRTQPDGTKATDP